MKFYTFMGLALLSALACASRCYPNGPTNPGPGDPDASVMPPYPPDPPERHQ